MSSPENMAHAFTLSIPEIYSFLCKGPDLLYIIKKESGFVAPLHFAHGSPNRTMFLMFLLSNDLVERLFIFLLCCLIRSSKSDDSIFLVRTGPRADTTSPLLKRITDKLATPPRLDVNLSANSTASTTPQRMSPTIVRAKSRETLPSTAQVHIVV